MRKVRSVDKDWEFVSRGTEISMGRFVSEHFTPLTLDIKTGVISDEDTVEIWETVKEVEMETVIRRRFNPDSRERGRKVFLTHQSRWLGGQQENEKNNSPSIQEDI